MKIFLHTFRIFCSKLIKKLSIRKFFEIKKFSSQMKKYDKISFISINEYYDNWKINTYVTLLLIFTLFCAYAMLGTMWMIKLYCLKTKVHTLNIYSKFKWTDWFEYLPVSKQLTVCPVKIERLAVKVQPWLLLI